MKLPLLLGLFALLPASLWLAGCATSTMSRIDANRATYESWPVEMRQAVLDGRIEKDMTPEMVEMVLGKPGRVESRADRRGDFEEVWIYGGSSNSPVKNANVGVGIGIGPVSIGGIGGGVGGSNAEYREVVFAGGKVVSGDDPK